jgi:hypothetical protein
MRSIVMGKLLAKILVPEYKITPSIHKAQLKL